jgi:hypothetical protein
MQLNTRLLSIPQASRSLGLTAYSVRLMVAKQELPSISVNGRRRILPEAIERLRASAASVSPKQCA